MLETIFCRSLSFNTLFLTRFRTYKIALPPQTKTSEGRGPQTDEHLPQLQVNFLHSDIWHCFLSVQSFSERATRRGAKEVQPNDDLFLIEWRPRLFMSSIVSKHCCLPSCSLYLPVYPHVPVCRPPASICLSALLHVLQSACNVVYHTAAS